jgi:hypothetical protein
MDGARDKEDPERHVPIIHRKRTVTNPTALFSSNIGNKVSPACSEPQSRGSHIQSMVAKFEESSGLNKHDNHKTISASTGIPPKDPASQLLQNKQTSSIYNEATNIGSAGEKKQDTRLEDHIKLINGRPLTRALDYPEIYKVTNVSANEALNDLIAKLQQIKIEDDTRYNRIPIESSFGRHTRSGEANSMSVLGDPRIAAGFWKGVRSALQIPDEELENEQTSHEATNCGKQQKAYKVFQAIVTGTNKVKYVGKGKHNVKVRSNSVQIPPARLSQRAFIDTTAYLSGAIGAVTYKRRRRALSTLEKLEEADKFFNER